jgi:ubiquinone/menaquinone biosynthesis C-methylase UbiE
MANVFHELDGSGTLNEVMRILKPGGRFAILDFKKIEEESGPPLNHRIDKPDAIEICINAGFNFVREFDTDSKSKYGLIFSK